MRLKRAVHHPVYPLEKPEGVQVAPQIDSIFTQYVPILDALIGQPSLRGVDPLIFDYASIASELFHIARSPQLPKASELALNTIEKRFLDPKLHPTARETIGGMILTLTDKRHNQWLFELLRKGLTEKDMSKDVREQSALLLGEIGFIGYRDNRMDRYATAEGTLKGARSVSHEASEAAVKGLRLISTRLHKYRQELGTT